MMSNDLFIYLFLFITTILKDFDKKNELIRIFFCK